MVSLFLAGIWIGIISKEILQWKLVMVKVELKAERNESTLVVFGGFKYQLKGKKRNEGSKKKEVLSGANRLSS